MDESKAPFIAKLQDLARGKGGVPDANVVDGRTAALVQVAALIATGAAPTAYAESVHSALAVGVTDAEIIDTLIAVSTTVGSARVVSAARGLSIALDYDIDAALEES